MNAVLIMEDVRRLVLIQLVAITVSVAQVAVLTAIIITVMVSLDIVIIINRRL